jgi:hypothetical protein
VGRTDAARDRVVRLLGEATALRAVERRIGGDHDENGIGHGRWRRRTIAGDRERATVPGIHAAQRVVDDQRTDGRPVRQPSRGTAGPTGLRRLDTAELGDRRAGARADGAFERVVVRLGRQRRVISRVGIGVRVGVADAQVEQDRRRHDRHRTHARGEADPALGEPTHHAIGRRQPERRATGQADGVDPLDERRRAQEIRLTRARCRSADIDAGDRALVRSQDHRAAGPSFRIGPVADADAGNVPYGQPLHGSILDEHRNPGAVHPDL